MGAETTVQQKPDRMAISLTSLQCYEDEGDDFLWCLVKHQWRGCTTKSGEKDGIHGMQDSIWSAKSRFKTTVNVRKVMATIFCNIQNIFTFSELCVCVCVRARAHACVCIREREWENDQQDAHFFSLLYFN